MINIEKEANLAGNIVRIGTDESGKGDFFGPLVTAAVLVSSEQDEENLLNAGVRDSKKISDGKVLKIADYILSSGIIHNVVVIGPQKYNQLYNKMKNLNNLLAWSHARAIENILVRAECNHVVSDQFGNEDLIRKSLFEKGKQVYLIQQHRAERDTAVAAASVLARAEFLKRLDRLSEEAEILLPKGAGPLVIEAGKKLADIKGVPLLEQYAKIHFKTYRDVLALNIVAD